MDSKTKILTLDHADTIRNFVKYNDSIIEKDLTKYIDDNINSESTARQNADNALDIKISEESTARQNADNALDNRTETLESSVSTLNGKVDTLEATVGNETSGLVADVNTLKTKTDALEESYDNLTGEIGEINNQLKDELLIEINNKISSAKEQISADYKTKVEDLTKELNTLIAESTESNQDKIDEIQLALSKLEGDTNNALSALDGLRRELESGEIFTEGQLDEIIRTVMITDVTIDDNTVEAPNIFSKNIVSLIAKFGQINAANIVGGDISGHTVKSTNIISDENSNFDGKPTWELQNEGSGHLANGNISWDNDGNVTFGEDVKLSWNNVKDAVNENIIIPDISEGYTEEQIKAFATEITNNTVTTGFVNALGITAKELSVEGVEALNIKADQIDTDNLVVKKLDTKYNEENTLTTDQVRIQDNVITVTGSENNKPVLQVTGEKLNEEFNFSSDYLRPASASIRFEKPDNPINVSLTNSPVSINEHKFEVGSIELIPPAEEIDNITSKTRLYSENGVSCKVTITSVTGNSSSFGALDIGFRCCVEKNGETVAEYKYNALELTISNGVFPNVDDVSKPASKTKQIHVPFDTICEKKYYSDEYTKKIYLVINNGGIINAGKIVVNVDFWGSDTSYIAIPYFKKHLITEMPNMNIAKDGIRYFVDDYNYFNIDDNGYFTYYGPGKRYGFGVNMNGAWVVIGGQEFYIANLNEQLKAAADSASVNNRNIKELKTEIIGEDGNGGLKHEITELNKFVKNKDTSLTGLAVKVNDLKDSATEVEANVLNLSTELTTCKGDVTLQKEQLNNLSQDYITFKDATITKDELSTTLSNYTKIISDDVIKSFIKNLNVDITCYAHKLGKTPYTLTVEKKDTSSIIPQTNYYETNDNYNIIMHIANLNENDYSTITVFPIEDDNYIIRPVLGAIYSYDGDEYNKKYVNVIEITSDKFNNSYEVNCEIINKNTRTNTFKPIKFKIVNKNINL